MCPVHLHCTTICGCDMWCKDKQQSNQPKYSADIVYIEISPSIAHISPATFEHTYEQYCWVSIIESLRFCNPSRISSPHSLSRAFDSRSSNRNLTFQSRLSVFPRLRWPLLSYHHSHPSRRLLIDIKKRRLSPARTQLVIRL